MRIGFAALTVAYVLSQFYRAFLAVLAPVLDTDIGASAEDLAFASGIWLAAFAGLQLPIGYALDYLGPRRTAGGLVLAAVGAAVFAVAHGPTMVTVAMALIGAGCAPALMVSLYIFARAYPPAMFASLTGLLIGVSSVGNLAAATPMAKDLPTRGSAGPRGHVQWGGMRQRESRPICRRGQPPHDLRTTGAAVTPRREERSTATTIAAAASYAESQITNTAIAHAFLYNASSDIGFLLSDLNNDDTF